MSDVQELLAQALKRISRSTGRDYCQVLLGKGR